MKPSHDTTLWTLRRSAREASAVLRHIEGYGYEVRLLHDGELPAIEDVPGRGQGSGGVGR
jgi:hypothetical protein